MPISDSIQVVYAAMEARVAGTKLFNAAKLHHSETRKFPDHLWLLRESSTVNGCLTVSFIKFNEEEQRYYGGNNRYILISEGGRLKWESVSLLSLEEIKEQFINTRKIVYMDMETMKKEEYREIGKSLFDVIRENGLFASSYLKPSQQEICRNSHYVWISAAHSVSMALEQCDEGSEAEASLIESAQEVQSMLRETVETECPITLEAIGDANPAMILGTRHLYNAEAASQWLANQGSDPLTRERMSSDRALRTNVCQKAKDASEQLIEAMAKRKK